MAVFDTKEVQVLDKPVIEINEKYEYSRALLQVWTGKLAGSMTVYSQADDYKKPVDLEAMEKGIYEVDIEEVHGKYGAIELRYTNPRLKVKSQPQVNKQ